MSLPPKEHDPKWADIMKEMQDDVNKATKELQDLIAKNCEITEEILKKASKSLADDLHDVMKRAKENYSFKDDFMPKFNDLKRQANEAFKQTVEDFPSCCKSEEENKKLTEAQIKKAKERLDTLFVGVEDIFKDMRNKLCNA